MRLVPTVTIAAVCVVIVSVSVAGCATTPTGTTNQTSVIATTTSASSIKLEGNVWKLTSLVTDAGMSNPIPNATITAILDNGSITGSAGCNRYFGSYELNKTKIEISSVGLTAMFCTDPAGIMMQETTYLQLLSNVSSYAISKDVLTLSNGAGTPQLVFKISESATTASAMT